MTPAISCPLWSPVYECQRVECNEPTSRLVHPIGTHSGEVMYFGGFALGVSLVS